MRIPMPAALAMTAVAGAGIGVAADAMFGDTLDKNRASDKARIDRARDQLKTPGLTPEMREGLQKIVDTAPSSSSVEAIAGGGAAVAGAGMGVALMLGALGLVGAIGGSFIDGGQGGEKMMTTAGHVGKFGVALGAGVAVGGAIGALID